MIASAGIVSVKDKEATPIAMPKASSTLARTGPSDILGAKERVTTLSES
jgi:hypothetical protein